jgi:hypothetical protein
MCDALQCDRNVPTFQYCNSEDFKLMYVTLRWPIIRVLLIVKREYLLEVVDIYVGYKVMCSLVIEQGVKIFEKLIPE